MHVLLLNQPFHPDVVATAQHLWDLARHLEARGHSVSVIASRRFYGSDRGHEKRFEKIGNIEIHRVGGRGVGTRSLRSRLIDFGSFYIAAAWKMFHIRKPDVIVALTTPPMISLLGVFYKQFAGARLVYYVMDVYPDVAVASRVLRRGGMLERILRRLTARTVQVADAIIVLGRDMRALLMKRYPQARAQKIEVIGPWADASELAVMQRDENPLLRELGLNRTFNVVYSGNLGIAHDTDTLLAAIEIMANDHELKWIFIGGGKRLEALKERARRDKWGHVMFLGYRERDELAASLNLADVHLVTQLPDFTGLVVPSKLFGIMAVGKPVIMVGPGDSECARIVSESGAGIVVNNGRAIELVDRLRELRANPRAAREMGARGRAAFERKFERRIACARIEALLERVMRGHGPDAHVTGEMHGRDGHATST
jgi:colanic acid biosynthesis glycosyl transferase WcaI